MKKKFRLVMLLSVLLTLILPVINVQADGSVQDTTPIIAPPSATLSQMQTWAQNSNATSTFIDLAKLYWNLSKSHGEIDPVVAYAQAAKETSFGRFGGVIDASYNNPCGLKTTQGGADGDPNAHMRFATWEQGVSAHLDHLALYAGAQGYPRVDTYDPRQFPILFGKTGNTVANLGGSWAPSLTYGTEIITMINAIKVTVPAVILDNKIALDNPNTNYLYGNNDLYVSGWVLSPKGIKGITILLDNKPVGNANYGIARPDVDATFPGYPEGSNSGYNFTIINTNITYGVHTITVQAQGIDGAVILVSKSIEKLNLDPILCIDTPSQSKIINGKQEIISGWALNQSSIKEIQVYINDKLIGNATYGLDRSDVQAAYPKYPDKNKVGFSYALDTSLINTSTANLTIKAVGNDGNILTRAISIKKPALSKIDLPSSNRYLNGKDIAISGWAINASNVKEAKVYVNNVYVGNASYGLPSDSIKDTYSYYSSSSSSGFSYNISSSKFVIGSNSIKVSFEGNDGTLQEITKNIEIYKGSNILCVDYPSYLINSSQINIVGWSLNVSGTKNIETYIDNKFVGNANIGVDRPDVDSIYPGYPLGDKSGFYLNLSVGSYAPGEHTLLIKAIGNDGTTVVRNLNINIKKMPAYMCIDAPSSNQKFDKLIEISGWALNPSMIKDIKVYLNDTMVGSATYGISRPDVNNALPGYTNGDLSGFYFKLPLNTVAPGNYVIKVVATGNDGSNTIATRNITVEKKAPLMSIDYPYYTNYINSNSFYIGGWALNAEGVKKVNVYLDNQLKGTAQYGLPRPDVDSVFPGYNSGAQSGFTYSLNVDGLSIGIHTIKLETIGNDNSTQVVTKSINIINSEPRLWVEDISTLTKDKDLSISGWALNKSGITDIKVYIDGKLSGTASYGISRPDVNSIYFGYPQGDTSGFSFNSPIQGLSIGKHLVRVVATGKDATYVYLEKSFTVAKLDPIFCLDTDFKNGQTLATRDPLYLRGWSLNDSGIKQIDFYLDGKYITSIPSDQLRPDVAAIYPKYPFSLNSGFSYNLDISKISNGGHTIEVYAVGNDKSAAYRRIDFKLGKTIMLDAGHGGTDSGAVGNGYLEKDLNMQLTQKVANKLQLAGVKVIFTRTSDTFVSLQDRVSMANSNGVDLFISIHQDSYTDSSIAGTSTHYSSYRPGIDTNGVYVLYKGVRYKYLRPSGDGGFYIDYNGTEKYLTVDDGTAFDSTPSDAAVKSAYLAQKLVDAISSLGIINRGISDHNLYVTRNTNMPSLLIEAGFISNSVDASKLADPIYQDKVAQKIADVLISFYGN